jgi:hypothetical protein
MTLLLSGRPNSRLLCIILQPGKCVQDTQQREARAYKARGFCHRGRVDASGHEIWSDLRGRRLLRAAALVAFFHPYFFAVRLAANACGACRRGGASLLAQVWSLRGNHGQALARWVCADTFGCPLSVYGLRTRPAEE